MEWNSRGLQVAQLARPREEFFRRPRIWQGSNGSLRRARVWSAQPRANLPLAASAPPHTQGRNQNTSIKRTTASADSSSRDTQRLFQMVFQQGRRQRQQAHKHVNNLITQHKRRCGGYCRHHLPEQVRFAQGGSQHAFVLRSAPKSFNWEVGKRITFVQNTRQEEYCQMSCLSNQCATTRFVLP